jgi:hypothetical protein
MLHGVPSDDSAIRKPHFVASVGMGGRPTQLLLLGWVWGAPPRLSPEWGFVVEQVTISAISIQIAVELLA